MADYYYVEKNGEKIGDYFKSQKEADLFAKNVGGHAYPLFYISNSEPRLKYKYEETVVRFPDSWKYCDYVWKMDLLTDVIAALTQEQDRLQAEFRSQTKIAPLIDAALGYDPK